MNTRRRPDTAYGKRIAKNERLQKIRERLKTTNNSSIAREMLGVDAISIARRTIEASEKAGNPVEVAKKEM